MYTESQLIYTIWDVVTQGESNADNPINERLMRNFLRTHRGRQLQTFYKKGALIPDESFQQLDDIVFTIENGILVSEDLPKIIRFRDRFGIALSYDGYVISVLESQEFDNSDKDRYNKYQPRVKFVGNKLHMDVGEEQICDVPWNNEFSDLNNVVRKLKLNYAQGQVTVQGRAVLVNTDDETGYDWTSDPYPLPDELIENIVNSVNAREFNIFLRTRSDETADTRNNTAEFNTREEV